MTPPIPDVKPIAFITSPFAGPDRVENEQYAIETCRLVALQTGYLPFAPHLYFTRFLNDEVPAERALGISYARTMQEIAARCGFFVPPWRPSFSHGMVHEHNLAVALRKPVDQAMGDAERRVIVDQWGHRIPPRDADAK